MLGFGSSPLELMARDAMLMGLVYLDEFTYSAAFITGTGTALAANGTTRAQIQINSDSDYLITLTRSGSGRELMNQSQPVANFCGNYFNAAANNPGRMPITSLYQGNGTLTVTLENRTATASNRADFTMRGFKVFYQTNGRGQTGNRAEIFHAL